MLEGLGDVLLEFLGQPSHVVILSMDFSHDSSAEKADAADQAPQEVIAFLQDDQASSL